MEEARQAAADLLHAHTDEIVFGANMTTLTLHLSRSLALELQPGDEIVVTRLDHDANIAPWLTVARDRGCTVRWLDFDIEDCTLKIEELERLLTPRTRLVAVGYASNAVGTVNPVQEIVHRAHQVGAMCYVDAVQYAPHGVIDVKALDADFLVVSAYKFFGPHVGVLYGKREHLERLPAYKVRPAPDLPPGKFETGTGNFEGIAGLLGAVEYLESLAPPAGPKSPSAAPPRAERLRATLGAIQQVEQGLTRGLLDALASIPGLRIYGLADPAQLSHRVPTVSFTVPGWNSPPACHSPRGDGHPGLGRQLLCPGGNGAAGRGSRGGYGARGTRAL